jgi:hypothetical protein
MNLVCESSHLCHSFFPRDPNYHSSFQWNTYTNPYINTHTHIYIYTNAWYIYIHTHIYIYKRILSPFTLYIWPNIISFINGKFYIMSYSKIFPSFSIWFDLYQHITLFSKLYTHIYPHHVAIYHYIPIIPPLFTSVLQWYSHSMIYFC